VKRRDFITLLTGAVAWPLAARAQQPDRMRRVGVLMAFDENDPEAKAYLSGFTQGLAELGWTDGRNLRMDVRWAAGKVVGCGLNLAHFQHRLGKTCRPAGTTLRPPFRQPEVRMSMCPVLGTLVPSGIHRTSASSRQSTL
jgi:hypothetical protein